MFPDEFLNAGNGYGAENSRDQKVQQEIRGNGFVVKLVILYAFVVEQKHEENDDSAQERNLRQVGDFLYPAFPENIAVLANKGIQNGPESGDHDGAAQQKERNTFAHFVQNIFAQGVERDPGQQSRQVIGNDQFNFLEVPGQSLEV